MRFAANLSTLCSDIPKLTDRFVHILARKDFKFGDIECQNPYATPLSEWEDLTSKFSVNWTLINTPHLFESWKENRLPTFEEYKASGFDRAIQYATALRVRKLHLVLMDGPVDDGKLVELLTAASRECDPLGITCVLEPLSIRPNYYLRSYDVAKSLVEKVNRPNLKVMLDTFHLQMLHGNLTSYFEKLKDVTGHVQVSQAPLRDSPWNSGEINYAYVFKKLSKQYDDVIGLEYNSTSQESFSWLENYKEL